MSEQTTLQARIKKNEQVAQLDFWSCRFHFYEQGLWTKGILTEQRKLYRPILFLLAMKRAWKSTRRKMKKSNISTLGSFSWILQTCFALCLCESCWSLWEVYENVQSREDERVREGREGEAEEEPEEGKEAMLRERGSWSRTGWRKYRQTCETLWENYEKIIRELWEHQWVEGRKRGGWQSVGCKYISEGYISEVYEKVMKTSKEGKREKTIIETRRGREREAEEEAEVRKQGGIGGGRSWRKAKGRGIKFWGEEGSKGRGNHERIMRRLWENHENIDGSGRRKKGLAANT